MIANCMLKTGCFPDSPKLAKIIALFKEGERSDPHIYRPVSVLSILAKILEKIIEAGLKKYITNVILFSKE